MQKIKDEKEAVPYFRSHLDRKLTEAEENEIREWYEKSDYKALSEGIAKAKTLKPMTDEEMLADLHEEVKSFLRAT
jgi:hypothetical protein